MTQNGGQAVRTGGRVSGLAAACCKQGMGRQMCLETNPDKRQEARLHQRIKKSLGTSLALSRKEPGIHVVRFGGV